MNDSSGVEKWIHITIIIPQCNVSVYSISNIVAIGRPISGILFSIIAIEC